MITRVLSWGAVVLVIVLCAPIVFLLVTKEEMAIYASLFLLLAGVLVLMWSWRPVDDRMDMEAIQLLRIKASLGILAMATVLGIAAMTLLGGARNDGKTVHLRPVASKANEAIQPATMTTPSSVLCIGATISPGVNCNDGKNGHDSATTEKSSEAQQPSATNTLPSVSPQQSSADRVKDHAVNVTTD